MRNSSITSATAAPGRLQRRLPAFADIVPVPGWDFDFHVAFDHCLAAKSRPKRQACRHVQPVQFIVFGFGQIFLAFLNDHVARGAGAASAAGML